MSLRLIAKEMYRLLQEADKIRQQIEIASLFERAKLEERLRVIGAEQDRMRRILDGAIDKKNTKTS
jgi:hypothetical protein